MIEGAQQIEVSFGGDASLPATVVGADPVNDLAVIKVDPAQVARPLEFADSNQVFVGQQVMAIGSPFGARQAFTRDDGDRERGGAQPAKRYPVHHPRS